MANDSVRLIPIFLLAQEASKSVKMVLSGEGSDEFLGGYQKHVAEVYSNSLLLNTILPTPSTTPAFGSSLGGGTSGAIAKTGTYRYGTEEAPPAPLDNSAERKSIFDEMFKTVIESKN
mgnify:CR=1 FL=1